MRRFRRVVVAATIMGVAFMGTVGACTPTASAARAPHRPDQAGPYGTPPWQESPGGYAGDNGTPTPAIWDQDVATIRDNVVTDPAAPLVFVGDSITYRWQTIGASVWAANFAGRAVDCGIGGDTTQNVLDRVDAGQELSGAAPATIVLLIGTNDFHHGWDPEQVTYGIVRTARTLEAKTPGANVVVVSLLPKYTPADPEWQDVIDVDSELGQTVPTLGGWASWLDVWPDFATADGTAQLPGMFNPLGVHPTVAGYQLLASLLEADPLISS